MEKNMTKGQVKESMAANHSASVALAAVGGGQVQTYGSCEERKYKDSS